MSGVPASSHGGGSSFTSWAQSGTTDTVTVQNTAHPSADALVLKKPVGGTGYILEIRDDNDLTLVGFDANGEIDIGGNNNVASIPVFISAAVGQTGDLLDVTSNSAAIYSGFNKAGFFFTNKHAAPADGDIAAGQLFLWFDQTNAAAKAMFKGKSADGTVVAAAITLA